MSLRKFGRGKILRDREEEREMKTASTHYTDEDRESLVSELDEDFGVDDTVESSPDDE